MGKALDLKGQKFARLTVIEKTNKRNASGQIYWKCRCDCGNICEITGSSLKNGHTKSCGCYNKEKAIEKGKNKLINRVGQKYGKLTVLKRAENHIQPNGTEKTKWLCKCDCGNQCIVLGDDLQRGSTKSCGCIKKSYGEDLIENILIKENLPFIQEKTFETCRFLDTNRLARFDFYVNNQYLIEYDGKQHFNQEDGWGESLEKIQSRDAFKNQWAKENNIPLYRVPYYDLEKINILDDILQDKYLVK